MCLAKHANLDSRNSLSDTIVSFHGEPTPKDWIFFNADGAISRTSRKAATGRVVVKAIHESVSKSSTSALIRRIHRILSQESQWILRYIPRKDNNCADYLAKLAFDKEDDLHLIESPQDEVLDFIKSDKERIFAPLDYSL
ncbi:hypothetical protein PVK06_009065 [Gossypium arboreum]|uniref:RNase H type-1 domain-containing protein n=1 Tax=Gossypium arboreum TaxID=29729 RepID=A0ABR0QLI6_GOSAR|nr:hypothetical protein PVK06_009065 [Gossypium arboreum]